MRKLCLKERVGDLEQQLAESRRSSRVVVDRGPGGRGAAAQELQARYEAETGHILDELQTSEAETQRPRGAERI